MPHNLVQLAVAAREASGAPRAVPAIDEHRSDDEGVTPADEVEDRWMRRLAAILEAPTGENSSDAAQLTTDLWIGGRSAAMDVLAANSRGITDLVNICEPWCPLGPNSESIQYVGIEAEDRASFPILSDKWYGKIRSHVCAGRTRGAVFLIHSDVGANRSAAIAAALLLDDGINNLIEIVRLLKERRPRCLTNKGFRLELVRKARRMNRLAGPDDPDYEPRRRPGLLS
ncbi:unnamed protein product [Pelagomonas calceolata]|uniref:Tyrosine specific protein phosphatases domain-containing protein n=1 Tax=Pelagomonas calceolata TaxID=35677 RepID=A0A8J2SVX0_9STRA|nr:unnamed protein product [Pelagomonas calceolata]